MTHEHGAEYSHGQGPALPRLIVDTLLEGRSLEAIALLARDQGISLREARVRIDEYIEHHPGVYQQLEQMRRETASNLTRFAVVIVILLALAAFWFVWQY